jgi:NADH:ubiquinone oxidoreductase subunit K
MGYGSRGGEYRPADAPGRLAAPRGSDRGRPLSVDGPVRGRSAVAEEATGRTLRGAFAVIAVFLVTLAGGAVDSFRGIGLSTVTLIALVGGTILGTWLVRRRDLVSMLIAPPLVFTAVAGVNIALAPSASFSLTTIAALLVRGFPTMGIATGVALVLCLIRWASRR